MKTMRMRTVLVAGAVVVVAGVGLVAGWALFRPTGAAGSAPPSCAGPAAKLTVQGSGQATGTPNLVTLIASVDVSGATAKAALADDDQRTAALVVALHSGGVAGPDVQTSGLSVQPQTNLAGAITGYQVVDTVTAKLRNMGAAGSLIDAVGSAVGNAVRIDSLQVSVDDPRPLEGQARADAIHQAAGHAAAMAAAAGQQLGGICSITDASSAPPYPYAASGFAAIGAQAPQMAVPIAAGSQQVSAQVTIVYALQSHT